MATLHADSSQTVTIEDGSGLEITYAIRSSCDLEQDGGEFHPEFDNNFNAGIIKNMADAFETLSGRGER